MSLFWLVYRVDDGVAVVLIEAQSLVFARLRAGLADLADGIFTEGHELKPAMETKISKTLIGRRLSPTEAEKLLNILARSSRS